MNGSTSIGSLNVGVTLDTEKFDAQSKAFERKVKAQGKQLDKYYESLSGSKAFGFQGGLGRGGGYRSMAGGASGGSFGERLARGVGGSALGKITGIGGIGGALGAAGSTGGVAAGLAVMAKLQMAIVGFAKESGKLDPATLAVMRYGDALSGIGKKIKDTAMGFTVEALGALNAVGEFAGGGFSISKFNAAAQSDEAAAQQEAARNKLYAENDPKALAATRSNIKSFLREQQFAGLSPKRQQDMLRDEIASLKTQEAKARQSKKILDAENLRLVIVQKQAELEKNIADFTADQRANDEAINLARLSRMDAEDEDRRKREKEYGEQIVEGMSKLAQKGFSEQLEVVKSRMGTQRNPFESAGVSGFGSASAAGAQFVQEGNRLMAQQLTALRTLETLLEDLIATQS